MVVGVDEGHRDGHGEVFVERLPQVFGIWAYDDDPGRLIVYVFGDAGHFPLGIVLRASKQQGIGIVPGICLDAVYDAGKE